MKCLERHATEGDSPVIKMDEASRAEILSTTGHVQSRGNPVGPSSKAKYSLATDSELVPRGKGEKNPNEGSEKNLKSYAYNQWKLYGPSARKGNE